MENKRRKIDDKSFVHGIVRESVHETLITLGFDMTDPTEIQQDVAWLRSVRISSQDVGKKAMMISITTIIGGILLSLWIGIKKLILQ